MNRDWEDRVRARAYAIWEALGRPDGGAEQHWLTAEEELRAEGAAPGTDVEDTTVAMADHEAESDGDPARRPTGTGTVAVGTVVDPELAGTSR